MNTIYILELVNNKYYIGKTKKKPEARFLEHVKGFGSGWTKKYEPLCIEKVISSCDDFDEDKWTKIYMRIYGINNVRGGTYSKITLDENDILFLTKEINHSNDNCLFCGMKGHFILQCPSKIVKKKINKVRNLPVPINVHIEILCKDKQQFTCYQCSKNFTSLKGLNYHKNIYCKSKPKSVTKPIKTQFTCHQCSKNFTSMKGLNYHKNIYCKSKPIKKKLVPNRKKITCYKCSRNFTSMKGLSYHKKIYCT
tara:strand:- start:160 stop:915 length:756 start_codon:yes stop_codon:yes gene_type:complete